MFAFIDVEEIFQNVDVHSIAQAAPRESMLTGLLLYHIVRANGPVLVSPDKTGVVQSDLHWEQKRGNMFLLYERDSTPKLT